VRRKRLLLRTIVVRLWKTYQRWSQSDCVDLSAAFAYYALQSIFPLLLIALAVAAKIYGKGSGVDEVLGSINPLLPPSVVDLVETTLLGLVAQGFGAGLLGVVVLVLTASNACLTLQRGADRLWDEVLPPPPPPDNVPMQVMQFLRSRLQAFLIVFSVAVLIVVEQILVSLSRLPKDLIDYFDQISPGMMGIIHDPHVFAAGSLLVSVLWLSLLALLLQKVLPTRLIPWKPLIPGSVLIGVALTLLNFALSLSIVSLGSRFKAYGVIGGVLMLTLWVWLIGVVLYFGQCLSVELVRVRLIRRGREEPILAQP
tara:strand:+ start:80 stop:1015 length:936 start_codon:yes stop_codon:yes gene_type:complete